MAGSTRRHPSRRSGFGAWALAAGAFFVCFSAVSWRIPDIDPEEAKNGLLMNEIWTGRRLPIVYDERVAYKGALKYYLYTPLYRVLGHGFPALRLIAFLGAALLIWALHRLLRDATDAEAADVFAAVCGTSLIFVQYSRLFHFNEYVVMGVWLALALRGFVSYARSGRLLHLCLAMAALGLGLEEKANFLWYLAGLALYAAARRPRFLRELPGPRWLGGAASFAAGYGLAIAYHVKSRGRLFRVFLSLLAGRLSYGAVDNQAYVRNAATRVGQFWRFALADLGAAGRPWDCGSVPWVALAAKGAIAALLLASIAHAARVWLRPESEPSTSRREAIYLSSCLALAVALGLPFSPSTLELSHFFLLWAPAYALLALFVASRPRRYASALLASFLVMNASLNLFEYARLRARGGGCTPVWNGAAWDVASYLSRRPGRVFAGNWNVESRIRFCSGESVRPEFYDTYVDVPGELVRAQPTFEDRARYFLEHARGESGFYVLWDGCDAGAERPALEQAAARAQLRVSVDRTWKDPVGDVVYTLYRFGRGSGSARAAS